MRHTIDTLTGRRFMWDETVICDGFMTVARQGRNDATHLHPSRVPYPLLRDLNPDKTDAEVRAACGDQWFTS